MYNRCTMTFGVGARLGPFEVLSPLGAGGMGEVYRAHDPILGRDVALKILLTKVSQDSERMARFRREAQFLASLNHPNIAAIYGIEENALVMELVEGPTLADRIAAGPVPLDDAVPIARQIAEALEYAHEKGVIHRDLKPANVKITPEGTVKVLDFGLAKAAERTSHSGDPINSPTIPLAATQAGMIMGTAAYMSPEQARGADVDRRADIWSFGAVLYEMLTGKRAFAGDTTSDILAAVLRADVDFSLLPANTPPWLRRLVERCLTRDRRKRLQAIGEARLLIEDRPVEALPSSDMSAGRRKWWIVPVAVISGVILGAAPLAFIHFQEKAPQVHPVRFQITLPDRFTFDRSDAPVISPDGRHVAIAAREPGGNRMLWMRSLDALTARQLPGTDGAFIPFWSPDSRSVAFVSETDRKLKKIDIIGGPPVTIAQTEVLAGGAWSRDGVILFNWNSPSLWSVSSNGGEPKLVLELDRSRNEVSQRYPRFLPDGRQFVYLSRNEDEASTGIYLASLDSKERRRLVTANSSPTFVLPGFLLFSRERTLFAQRFDPSKGQLSGEALPVAESLGGLLPFGNLHSASESGDLAFLATASPQKQLAWYDRGGRRLGPIGETRDYQQFSVSPDARRLAAQVRVQGGRDSYWQLDLTSGILSRLTSGANRQDSAAWSPDGNEIILGMTADGRARIGPNDRGGNLDLFRKVVGSSAEQVLFSSKEPKYPAQWLNDGSVLFTNHEGKSFYRLRLQKGSEPEVLFKTDYRKDGARVSPDERWISYNADESGQWEVYIASYPAFEQRRQVSRSGGVQGLWGKDGKELYYLTLDGVLMSVSVKAGTSIETGIPKPLFTTRIPVTATANQYEAFDHGRKFLLMESVGTEAQPITVLLNALTDRPK